MKTNKNKIALEKIVSLATKEGFKSGWNAALEYVERLLLRNSSKDLKVSEVLMELEMKDPSEDEK